MNITKFRDLTFVSINRDQLLVIACDSSGGIGNKEKDIVKVSPELLGYFNASVALKEIISVGANPILVVNTLSIEMNDTGKQIIEGIKRAVQSMNIDNECIITGSTEENFPVIQTGMGITVIGIVSKAKWNFPKSKRGALIVVAGLPKVGDEVLDGEEGEILTLDVLIKLKEKSYIQEILPVGSKGILNETEQLAETNGLSYVLNTDIKVDLKKSAGPSTCAIVTVDGDSLEILEKECPIPINPIGKLI